MAQASSCTGPTPKEAALSLADGSPQGAAVAALESLTAIVERLGSLGSDRSDARGGYGKGTLLMNGKCTLELARWAIERGTDVNAGDAWGYTPLHESARARDSLNCSLSWLPSSSVAHATL